MKILCYFLVVVFGAFGLLALLRCFEILIVDGHFSIGQLFFGIVGILLAWSCLKRAREP
jgi:hypothetical protein